MNKRLKKRYSIAMRRSLAAFALMELLFCPSLRAEVVISEIHYHPASEDVSEEYIELLNTGAAPVSLNGWQFTDGISFTFPNITLAAGERIVVAANLATFSSLHPGVTNVVGNWVGQLSNSDEDIDLDDALGDRVDSVQYADKGEWAERHRGPLDNGHQGWKWIAAHDGGGKSLELINPMLSNNHGQNWKSSLVTNGTPGAANSAEQANVAPLILEVQHLPVIPRSVDDVLITARLLDEGSNLTATVFWRVDGAPSFSGSPMFDDGLHDDGSPGDGIFATSLPAQPADSVVEFYVEAADPQLLTRTWPAPALDTDGVTMLGQVANALYQVDDTVYSGSMPLYKFIMTDAERQELYDIGHSSWTGEARTDAQMNATFIGVDGTGTEVRYVLGIRNRGHFSSGQQPNSYRVNFNTDRRWKGIKALNINGQYTHCQIIGSVLSLKAGLPAAESRPVQVRVNNANLGDNGPQTYGSAYAANEAINSDWADNRLPNDSSGNAYKILRDILPDEFNYRGEDPNAYTNTYFKATNESEDDWADLIAMLRIMGTNDLMTAESIRSVVNVEEWMTYCAVLALFNSQETSPNRGYNDDYYLYAGVNDPRFQLVPYDLDTIIGEGDTYGSRSGTIFGAFGEGDDNAFDLSPLLAYPEFEALYYQTMQHLLDTTFSQDEFNATLDQTLADFVPELTLESMRSWMDARRDYVQGVISPYLATLTNAPAAILTGEPRSPTPDTTATLTVGGDGVTKYRYSLNGSAFGPETPVAVSISLSGLSNGSTNTVRVIGSGPENVWQDEADATVSLSWVVETSVPSVRINEVMAANETAYNHYGTYPDVIELYNEGSSMVDLSGLRLSDKLASPNKFSFPNGTTLDPGAYLVVLANDTDGTPGFHTDYSLSQNGEGVFLFDSVASGGALLDSVSFGLQLPDYSFGRLNGGAFVLTQPTFGTANTAQPTASIDQLRVNEWLALGSVLIPDDFVEIYNSGTLPVDLGGLYLTDNPIGEPMLHKITPLTFIAAEGYREFIADNNPGKGADHVSFKLPGEQGIVALLDADLDVIDCVVYGPQQPDISQGRTPDAAAAFAFFLQPSPGAPNPAAVAGTLTLSVMDMTNSWAYYQSGSLDGMSWTDPGFNDSAWPEGAALLYAESSALPAPKNTPLTLGETTYYFRSHFTYTNNPSDTVLRMLIVIDDAAVIYLNGDPVYWLGFSEGAEPVYADLAERVVGNAVIEGPFSIPSDSLVMGDNVIAVEVHQQSTTSTDVCMGLELEAVITTPANVSSLVLNEVMADNQSYTNTAGRTPDWVELLNTGTNTVDVTDLSLTDDPGTPRKWIFSPGTMLAPGARLVVEFDGSIPASSTNTGFGLSSDGETVLLYNNMASGGGELDSISFGLQIPDYSIARSPDGSGEWTMALPTADAANVPAGLGNASLLRINEWMAIPNGGDDWFELYNPNPQPVALYGLALTDDPADRDKSPFPPLSFIAEEGFRELKADGNAGANHVAFSLNGGGDFIGLYRSIGTQVDGTSFGQQVSGISQGRFPDGDANILNFPDTPSPGAPNYYPLDFIVINELLSHTDPPLEDAVEIHNTGSVSVDMSGWYLSDSALHPKKFLLPADTIVPPGGYAVLYEYQFVSGGLPGVEAPFSFNSAYGGEVVLSQTDSLTNLTGYRAVAEFVASANGVSFGRFSTTAGEEFVPMSGRTFGEDSPASLAEFRLGTGMDNAYPQVGPVVFGELNYHSVTSYGGNTNAGEYIELQNASETSVPLYDPAYPTNTWRISAGVDFTFPVGVSIPASGTVVVVSFNPDTDTAQAGWFRSTYEVPAGTALYGPWTGSLANEGETVKLYRPDTPQLPPSPDAGYVPQLLVERVAYDNAVPWPTNGIGTGAALQRFEPNGFGNEPGHWFSAEPSAGRDNRADTDNDGMPDYWELENGLNPDDNTGINGASGNLDGDTMTNIEEWQAGTAANNALDDFRILAFSVSPDLVDVLFRAAPGRRYSLLSRDSMSSGTWEKQSDAPLTANPMLMEFSTPRSTNDTGRYYILEATTEILP